MCRFALVVAILLSVFSTAAASLNAGQVSTAIVVNDSPRYLSASFGSSTHTLAVIHPKILGQPNTGIGYGDVIAGGNYTVKLRFQSSAPLSLLKLKVQTDSGDIMVINLLEPDRNYYPDTWFELTVPISAVPTVGERWRFSISLRVAANIGTVTVNVDDIEISKDDTGTILKGDLSFDDVPFAVAANPPKSLIVGSSRFDTFAVKENLRWQRLSDWYEENRVQQHSRYSPSDYTIPYSEYLTKSNDLADPDSEYHHWYWHGANYAASIGARVWTRHVKSRMEGPHWLTEVPQQSGITSDDLVWQELLNYDLADRNPIDDFLLLANDNNLQTIAYYRMIGDTPLAGFSPYDTWFALKPNGQPVSISADLDKPLSVPGNRMSMFSPYPLEVVRPRIIELAEKGFAGAYFDSSHGITNGDWSHWAAQAMLDRFASALPSERNLGLLSYRQLLSLHTSRLADVFANMQQHLHSRFPDFQFIVSAHRYADLVSLNSSVDLVSLLQVPKTERKHGHRLFRQFLDREVTGRVSVSDYPNDDLGNEFGVTLIRDTANGRPPHVWVHNPVDLVRFHENGDDILAWELGISTHQLLAASASVLAMGAVANVDIYDDYDDGLLSMPATHATPVFAMGQAAESFLSYSRPLKTVCIHVNEQARDDLFDQLMTEFNSADVLEQHWRSLIAPVIFAFDTIRRAGVPVGFVTDPQLSAHEIGNCRALVLPSANLTPAQTNAVNTFSQAGGVVTSIDHLDWSRRQPRSVAAEALTTELQSVLSISPIAVSYSYGEGRTNGFFVRHDTDQTDTVIVAVSGDVAWLRDPSLTPAQKKDYVPGNIPAATVTLRGINVTDIESVHALRYANTFQSWVTSRVWTQDLLVDAEGVHVPLDQSTVGSSKHLRLLRVKLNRKLP